jgi:deuterolysin
MNYNKLDDKDFESIAAGQSVSTVFNVAELFDLSNGGSFAIKPTGSLKYAKGGNALDIGTINYVPHEIVANIDGEQASSVRRDLHALYDRAAVSDDCPYERYNAAHRSIQNVHDMAQAAAEAARYGEDRLMDQVFRRSDYEAREIVAETYDKMVQYYSSDEGGIPRIHCADVGNLCSPRTTAYVLPEKSVVVFCDNWFEDYVEQNPNCERHDQSVIAVHEASHLDEIKGTTDNEGVYDNLNHADSYGVFAHLVQNDC